MAKFKTHLTFIITFKTIKIQDFILHIGKYHNIFFSVNAMEGIKLN